MFKVKLPFYEMAGEIGSESGAPSVAAEGVEPSGEGNAPTPAQNGEESQSNPSDDVTKQQSFAKRLKESIVEERAKWEAEQAERYKDYDVAKKSLEFMMRSNNISDPMTLKEQIELAELQEKAERENLTVEELQRRQELEELKAWKNQVIQSQQEQEHRLQFETTLKTFCEGKKIGEEPLDHAKLWQYMFENQTNSPEVAYKAMKADYLEQQVANAEKEGMKKLLSAKGSMPKVEGNHQSGTVLPGSPKTFADARARAMQRMGG